MTKDNNILKNANKAFREKRYEIALDLYETASHIYGRQVVEINIRACLDNLGRDKVAQLKFDPITRLLLKKSDEIKLSDSEQSVLLSHYEALKEQKSELIPTKSVNPIPSDWPEDLELTPLPDGPNDYEWYQNYRYRPQAVLTTDQKEQAVGLSIVIPTYDRKRILSITLACLCHQNTEYPFEVIVADDGSKEELAPIVRMYENQLDIKYVRQKDYGYQLCAVRNLGLRTAKYEFVSILDCDMAPGRDWVQSYMDELLICDDIAMIGPRKYIDTNDISPEHVLSDGEFIENLPEIRTNNNASDSNKDDISVDWRLEHFKETEDLRLCDSAFRFFSGGNVAFSKKWLRKIGFFDEDFKHWGGEDNEFGYRLFRAGCFFKAVHGAMAFHQEPPGLENETDRSAGKAITYKIVMEKVPYFYRKPVPIHEARIHQVPLVSIYVPAYNCEETITKCVNSALNQTYTDLEVCICDDGSTDRTLDVLKSCYNDHPRVKFVSTQNGGIGSASNNAVKLCRGFYIGQLDADDYLEPDAVENCMKEFINDRSLACVYTGNRNVDPDGNLINVGYNWPEYSRRKLICAMTAHHFRMFSVRAWNLTDGFDENIVNAVDYDMYLKLSDIGPFKHLNCISYNRVLHGDNTSIKNLAAQKVNHFDVVNRSLKRQNVSTWEIQATSIEDDSCRKYKWSKIV